MDFRFLMTGRTNNLAFLERLTEVAVGTDQRSVLAGELKYRGMIKICHTINPVMTLGARAPKGGNMTGHKIGILERVAFLTGKGWRVIREGRMALQTGYGIAAKPS